MDLQRSLLIGAIAVLSFMLLTEWVSFKEEKTAATAQVSSRPLTSAGNAVTDLAIEDTSAPAAPLAEDIPVAPQLASDGDLEPPSIVDSTRNILS